MQLVIGIAFTTLKVITTTSVLLNELTMFTSPWIVLPSKPSTASEGIWLPWPSLTVLAYAIAEPLCRDIGTVLTLDEPWILVLQLPPFYLWTTYIAMTGLRFVGKERSESIQKARHQLDTVHSKTSKPSRHRFSRSSYAFGCFMIQIPIVVAAATNAGLAAMMNQMQANRDKYRSPVILGLSWLGIIIYWGVRHADLNLCRHTYKWPVEGRKYNVFVKSALPYGALLIASKAAVRVLLGQRDPFGVLPQIPGPQRHLAWTASIASWLAEAWSAVPIRNVPPVLWTPISIICQAIGVCLLVRASRPQAPTVTGFSGGPGRG